MSKVMIVLSEELLKEIEQAAKQEGTKQKLRSEISTVLPNQRV